MSQPTARRQPARLARSLWGSVRGRLFLLVLLTIIPAVAVQLYGAWSNLQQNLASRKTEVTRAATHAQGDFSTLLDRTRTVFTDLVRLNEMRNPNNCTLIFSSLRLAYERLAPEATNLALSDSYGNLYCAVNPVQGERNVAAQAYFQNAVKTLDLAVGPYGRNLYMEANSFTVAYPVTSFEGEVQTVIVAVFELRWLSVWQAEAALPPGAAYTLLSPEGELLHRVVDGAPVDVTHPADWTTLWRAPLLAGQGVVELPDLDKVVRLHTLVPLAMKGQTAAYLQVGYPVAPVYATAYQALEWELMLVALTTVAALAIAALGSESLFLRPLRRLMSVAGQVEAGDLAARAAGVRGLLELTWLAEAFDRMAGALQQRETDRQRAQTELQESEARFRAILDNAAVGVAVMTLDRRLVQMNPTAVRLIGYTVEEMEGVDPSLLAVEADRDLDREMFQELVAGQRSQYLVEKRYARKDGTVFWGRVNFALVRDAQGQPLYTIGMIEDITDEKQSAERLAAQEAEYRRTLEQRIDERTRDLNQANERLREKAAQDAVTAERTRLARDLHDAVTQTLFSATLIADVLPDLWRMNPAEGLRRLEELHQLNRGALAEMRTLLMELRPNALVEVPLSALLRQLADAFTGRARLNIQLSAEGSRKLPPDVQIGLYRIAQEALNNAVKHAKASQAVVTLRQGETVRLTVADNGTGFDASTVTADHLGLKIMHERAEAIQAHLSIYSEPGEGTQISVTWS